VRVEATYWQIGVILLVPMLKPVQMRQWNIYMVTLDLLYVLLHVVPGPLVKRPVFEIP
jgi:hypothetical protein